jgi:exosome complex exonuclease RRP6
MLVDTAAKMKQCIYELEAAQPFEIAFDVESFNVSKHTQLTCLLQIASDAGKEYVIDTLAPGVWEEVHGLAPLLADPAIVKIGHSIAGLDVRSLHRDFGCFLINTFDTYEAARLLELPHHGLAAVCAHYRFPEDSATTYATLKEEYQRCDWRVRPLTEPMIRYAARRPLFDPTPVADDEGYGPE